MKYIYSLLLAMSFTCIVDAQSFYWRSSTASKETITRDKATARTTFPSEFRLFDLDLNLLKNELFQVTDNQVRHSTVISIPNTEGQLEQFEITEASNFEPELQARFPEIRAFSGRGITDKYSTLKLSYSPHGIQTMIFRTGKENEFIEPYSSDHRVYAVFKSQRTISGLPWTCSTVEQNLAVSIGSAVSGNITARSGGDLKTMRLAQSVTAEYSNYFGATSSAQASLVLAAVNNTLTRCNGVYEKDLALHLNLIANTTSVFYYNASTDPYSAASTGAGGAWNSELQNTLTSVIGEANYDIGHLFGASGGGGNAGCIGCVCTNGSKGSGFTSPADGIPQGDNFDIDYVVHEVGHQLGANHTFSHNLEGTGVNKEVGSGITIMGYAGITSYDVANHSIDIYHQASIAQIQANLLTKTCPVTTSITANNATPVVNAVSNYTIPISTPFALIGTATDANGDALTYCWEQNDNSSVSGANSVASPTKASGPNWISFPASASGTRYFPKLSTILAGNLTSGPLTGGDAGVNTEALSSVSRTLNFRLTVRDNCPYSSTAPVKVGQTQFTDMAVTVSNTSGPFSITQPNTNVSWPASSSQTITWNVASTTSAPVSCANVKITMSTDGGQTFPYVLSASTANDGSEVVTIPAVSATTTARVKVEAVGNIFFDISNSNFAITAAGTQDFNFNSTSPANAACGDATATISLGTTAINGFSTPINLTTSGNPAGTTVSFSVNPLTPGNTVNVTLNNVNTLAPGTYNITVTGTAGSMVHTASLSYVVAQGTLPSIATHPADVAVCSGSSATFNVAINGSGTYQWQRSTDAGVVFSNISGATSSSYTIASVLLENAYKYRVVVTGLCNTATSNPATLTINQLPPYPTITPVNPAVCLGGVQQLNAANSDTFVLSFGRKTSLNTQTTGSGAYPAPYNAWYGAQRMQMLIKSEELYAAGFIIGSSINSLEFFVNSRGSNWTNNTITSLQGFKLSIAHTNLTTLSAFQSGLQVVVPAANFTPVVNYNNHYFNAPFIWDGRNIIIETTWGNNIGGTSGDVINMYNTPTNFQSCIVYRADNVTSASAASATTISFSYNARPDFRLKGFTIVPVTWSPVTNLYTDAAATVPYSGNSLATVYSKPTVGGTANYSATGSNNVCSSTNSVSVAVNSLPAAPTATDGSRCGTGTVSLSASSAFGTQVDWYDAASGGSLLASASNSYTTPTITATTVYYAQTKQGTSGCISSSRTAVTATVNTPVALVLSPTNITMCPGTIQQLSVSNTTSLSMEFGTQANTNTASTTSTGYPAPYSAYYGAQRMQMLLKADELTAAGYTAGSVLSSLAFNVVSKGSGWGSAITSLNNFKISIGNTNLTSLSAFQSGLQVVKSAANFTPATGWNTHSFDVPYTWNGTSNLIVDVTWGNNITGGSTQAVFMHYSPTSFTSSIVYRANNVTSTTAAAATTVNFSYSFRPDFRLNGSGLMPVSWSPATSLFTNSQATIAYTGTATTSVYVKPSATGNVTYTATPAISGCTTSATANVVTVNCQLALNLKLFLEGYYLGSSTMHATLFEQGISSDPNATDTVTIDLWSVASIQNTTPDYSFKSILKKDGSCVLNLNGIPEGGAYYIAVRHRNHLELWSANPVTLASNTVYDFSNSLVKAYTDGSNPPMMQMAANVYALYAGDLDDDGVIESADYSKMENDINLFLFGYYKSDITGDRAVESADYSLIENNLMKFLFVQRPGFQRHMMRKVMWAKKR